MDVVYRLHVGRESKTAQRTDERLPGQLSRRQRHGQVVAMLAKVPLVEVCNMR